MTTINTNYTYSTQSNQTSDPLKEKTATTTFLDYMSKTTEERMIEQILNEMGLTKEDLEKMTPKERLKVEEKIREKIEEKVEAKVKY